MPVDTHTLVLPRSSDFVFDTLRQLAAHDFVPPEDPAVVHIRAGTLFASLKALNRNANAAARTHKQATTDARQEMDQTYLDLQNLLYEKRHLEREIDKCRQFAYAMPRPSPRHSLTNILPVQYIRTYRCTPSSSSWSLPRSRPAQKMCCRTSISSCSTDSALNSSSDKGLPHPVLARAVAHHVDRLDRRAKELAHEKEELLKETKVKAATMESVKVQIDTLMKVSLSPRCFTALV